jgi:hypothetical protein
MLPLAPLQLVLELVLAIRQGLALQHALVLLADEDVCTSEERRNGGEKRQK